MDKLKNIASQVRRDIIRMTHNAGNGHPGGALGCTELFVLLYFKVMKHSNTFSMDGKGEDLFFLSNGHISAGWYSTLARAGYFSINELSTHRKINSRLQGHPTPYEKLPGIRLASGSLGQGLSVATGAAISKSLNGEDRFVYVLMGDGEQQEGQVWEAAMFANHQKVTRLIAFIDYNNKQIDGDLRDVMDIAPIADKYEAFGWQVLTCNGNDMEELDQHIQKAQTLSLERPVVIIMHTKMGAGVDFMEDDHNWHGVAPNDAQCEAALAQLEETLGDFTIA